MQSGHRKEPGTNDEIREFRSARMQLSQLWLSTPLKDLYIKYQNGLRDWHCKLCSSLLKGYRLTLEEGQFVDNEVKILSGNLEVDSFIQHVMATMLYLRPYQMPITLDIEKIPAWFRLDYFRFLLEAPGGVLKTGESDVYCRHIGAVIQNLAEHIRTNPGSELWRNAATNFVQISLLIPLYFTLQPLRELYVARGDIFQYVCKSAGCDMDYHFSFRPENRKKIRLGVHLTNLRSVTEMRATLPIFEFLDRKSFEVFLYVSTQSGNEQEKYCRSLVDHFAVLPKDLHQWGEAIRADDLDILILGNNSTAGLNGSTILGTHRLARVQCVHFCSPVTTGLKHVDYFLMGTLIGPEGKADGQYSEKILRVPGSGICFSMGPQSKVIPGQFERRNFGIPDKCPLFVSGANFYKITPELRTLWALIMAGVPESVLALYPFGPAWSSSYPERQFTEEMKSVFNRYGIAKERLIILKPFENRYHIKSFLMLSDVYLDATPYSGATSLLDPLEMAVPPVLTEGAELRFCQGAAMLKELGVPDLVAQSEEAYVRLAVRLGTDRDFRQAKSTEIREKMAQGPAFLDSRSYAEKVGKAFKSVVDSWVREFRD